MLKIKGREFRNVEERNLFEEVIEGKQREWQSCDQTILLEQKVGDYARVDLVLELTGDDGDCAEDLLGFRVSMYDSMGPDRNNIELVDEVRFDFSKKFYKEAINYHNASVDQLRYDMESGI